MTDLPTLRIGHSPDADDAFMFWALAGGRAAVEGYRVEHVMEDIESLNRRAQAGDLDGRRKRLARQRPPHER